MRLSLIYIIFLFVSGCLLHGLLKPLLTLLQRPNVDNMTDQEFSDYTHAATHCSALVKVRKGGHRLTSACGECVRGLLFLQFTVLPRLQMTPDFSDIFFTHTTWCPYAQVRVGKGHETTRKRTYLITVFLPFVLYHCVSLGIAAYRSVSPYIDKRWSVFSCLFQVERTRFGLLCH